MVDTHNMIVFVSYSSTNREVVEALVLQLGELGHDVEYDVKFIGAPMTWRHIFTSITTCDLFITAVTREMLVSATCEIEYQYARSIQKNVLAVLLEDLTTEDFPDMRVKGLIDLRLNTEEARVALYEAINALPPPIPPPSTVVPSANWLTPLLDLRKRIENLSRDAKEQRAVVLNVKEFLERREPFEVARSLLELLAVQQTLRPQTLAEVNAIRNEIRNVRVLTQTARRRRTVVGAIVLSSLVALIAVVLSQLFFRFRANYNVELSMTRTAEAIAASQVASVASETPLAFQPTLVATREFSPTPADTEASANAGNLVVAATVVLSTNTPIIPVLTATPTPALPTFTPTMAASATVTFSPEVSQGVADAGNGNTDASSANLSSQSVYIGITVEDTSMGLKIINTNSNAQASGVQIGDYILGIGSEMITTRAQFLDTMSTRKPSSNVSLYLWRGGRINVITLVLGVSDFSLATGIP